MPFIQLGTDRIHYQEEGRSDGPPVLMVHGSCGNLGQWRQLVAVLGGRFHVFRMDLPGMGESSDMPFTHASDVAGAVEAHLVAIAQDR